MNRRESFAALEWERALKVQEIVMKAMSGEISWLAAADTMLRARVMIEHRLTRESRVSPCGA